jgi:hypothetical protein
MRQADPADWRSSAHPFISVRLRLDGVIWLPLRSVARSIDTVRGTSTHPLMSASFGLMISAIYLWRMHCLMERSSL